MSRDSSSTTSPRADSSSTTSPTPRVRCLGGAARHAAHRRLLRLAQARCRLLRLRRASGCLGTPCGSSRGSSSTILPTPGVWVPRHVARLVVDYFTYVARPVASAHRAACRVTRRRLLRLVQARRRLLCLRCASGCLCTSRARHAARRRLLRLTQARRRLLWLRRASGCTRLVVNYFASRRLVVDYFAYATMSLHKNVSVRGEMV
jgi:hypothetical protein